MNLFIIARNRYEMSSNKKGAIGDDDLSLGHKQNQRRGYFLITIILLSNKFKFPTNEQF